MLAAQPFSMRASAALRSAGSSQCPISAARTALPMRRRLHTAAVAAATGADDDGASAPSTSTSGGDDELARLLKADMERFSASSAGTSTSPQQQQKQQQQQQQLEQEGGVKATLDRLLVADFFAVLAALAWLGAGLAEKAAFGSTRLVDAWMPLWPLLWQPLIGVLMAGALVSGGAGWLASKQQEQQQQQQGRR